MSIVKTTSVQKQFEEGRDAVPVLHGIDFNVDRGEIVSLEGPSGSGKTTFLSILGAILTPTAGQVTVNGERIDGASESKLAAIRRKSLGFVFQQFNLFPSLSALENVEYALNVKGMKGNAARIEAERVIEAVGLADRRNYLPRDLSGGQKQRVAIARALAGSAPVLLADEPTANLDSVVGSQILDMFRALAKRENRALVIVTHDPKVRTIADRVVSIRDGRIAA
jgi:putative ABC transport system ATP-binding protein